MTIYSYEERKRENDRQTNYDSHVATRRVKYNDATFLSWFKSICHPATGILIENRKDSKQLPESFCFRHFENWKDPEQSSPFEGKHLEQA